MKLTPVHFLAASACCIVLYEASVFASLRFPHGFHPVEEWQEATYSPPASVSENAAPPSDNSVSNYRLVGISEQESLIAQTTGNHYTHVGGTLASDPTEHYKVYIDHANGERETLYLDYNASTRQAQFLPASGREEDLRDCSANSPDDAMQAYLAGRTRKIGTNPYDSLSPEQKRRAAGGSLG